MGPALNVRSSEIVAGYASFAVADVDKIHKDHGVVPPPGASAEMCPHASAARAAARMAKDLAAAAKDTAQKSAVPTPTGCPFHHKEKPPVAPKLAPKSTKPASSFGYELFYKAELDKKHQDNSYRYFTNINRLAAKFPLAHRGNVKDEVQVWCANDYLGMGNNPVVLETLQYAVLCLSL
jgi:5-aminolevulinate synthase